MLEGSPATQLTDVDPRQLGKWTVQSRIGSGGMGVVYRAVHGQEVAAVKVVRPGLLDDPQVAARFAREAQVLRSVQDAHISRFLDEDIAGFPAWLATEYVPGPNLRDAVNLQGPLPAGQWWESARGLAQALAVLEIHGIAHRDIKPANVIMSDRGPVLIDFGIAHPEDATSLTATGIVTGSPAWLSPEQVNLEDLSAASDIFSLGSLLAFAATGRPPFGQGATVAVLMSIQRNEPNLEGVDPVRVALLQRMLDKDPARRPSAREVLQIARGAQDDRTVDVRVFADLTRQIPAPVVQRPARPARKVNPLVVVLAAVLAAIVGYFGFGLLGGSSGDSGGSKQPSTSSAPAFPGSDQLRSGDWLLSRYSIDQTDGGRLVINGTVMNTGDKADSTKLDVYYYIDGKPVAVASGNTGEVTAGGSAEIRLSSDEQWQPGQPVLVVRAG